MQCVALGSTVLLSHKSSQSPLFVCLQDRFNYKKTPKQKAFFCTDLLRCFFLRWKEAMVMWPYRFVFLQVHLVFFFLWTQPQSFWKYCVNMWHWDTIWLSLFNYMSSSIELRSLVPAPPSSAHLLKQTCSSDVAKHCAFFGMLKACLRGVTLVLWYRVAGVFWGLRSFQQTHWSWQAFVFVMEKQGVRKQD